MELLNIKNYCFILLNSENNSLVDMLRISETTPTIMQYNSTGVIVATFSSYLNINEITEYVKSYDVNFFIFEISDGNFGRNITDQQTDNELFEFIDKLSCDNSDIAELYDDEEIAELYDDEEIEDVINQILDKGYNNISESDKVFLKRLTNK